MPSRSLLSVQEKLERRWRYVCEAGWMGVRPAMQAYYDLIISEPALHGAIEQLWVRYSQVTLVSDLTGATTQPKYFQYDAPMPLDLCAAAGAALLTEGLKLPEGYGTLVKAVRHADLNSYRPPPDLADARRAQQEKQHHDFLVCTYLRPLHEYLLDALDSNVETLAAIRCFQDWARWFGESRFQSEISKANDDKDRGKARALEKRLQLVMFEKLYDYGLRLDVDIWREPVSDTSRPDFKVLQRTATDDRPITVEVKVIKDGTTPSKAFGALQLLTYMASPSTDTGYLVIFDETREGHILNLSRSQDGLYYLAPNDHQRVYVILVPTVSQLWASEDKRTSLTDDHFMAGLFGKPEHK